MVSSVTQPGRKDLEASAEIGKAVRAHYANVKAAKAEGKAVIWAFGLIPKEIFNALDAPVISLEHFPILVGAKQLSGQYCQIAEEEGFTRDLCAFHVCFIGCAASEEKDPYVERLFTPPDLIVASNYPCMSESHSFRYSVNRFNCPYFFIDAPINTWGKDIPDYAIKYYTAQLDDLFRFLEKRLYGRVIKGSVFTV